MAQDQHQEIEATSVMVTTWLTPHEARTLEEMASARYTTTADTVRQAVKIFLRGCVTMGETCTAGSWGEHGMVVTLGE